jgi:hypothetical protein
MLKRTFFPAMLLLAFAPFAVAAELTNNCRLKGGSMVLLAAEACVMEGGVAVTSAGTPVLVAAPLELSADPKLASAQQEVATLLMKMVVDSDLKKRQPEVIQRTVKFDGCSLQVEEDMFVDHGTAWSSRKHFKINSTVDMSKVSRSAFGELGKVTSYGGGMKTYANYLEEEKESDGNHISIAVLLLSEGEAMKYKVTASDIYWDAPIDDLWLVDEFGYPKDKGASGMARDKVRLLFLMNTPEDSAALNKALGKVHALCQRK